MSNKSFLWTACACFAALCFNGCGPGEEKLDLVPASGVLKYKGQPLSGYEVYFKPVGEGRSAFGKTDEQGKFTLGTVGESDGAMVGSFAVYIKRPAQDLEVEPGKEEIGMVKQVKSVLPSKIEDPATSGLLLDIPAGGSSSLDISL